MKIDGIIFDLDGTLWDSTDVVLKAWNHVLKDKKEVHNIITKEKLEGIMGLQLPEIAEKFFPDLEEKVRIETMEQCCSVECDFIREEGGNLYPHMEKILNILSKKYPLFIVSNCQCGYIESFLDYHELQDYFQDTKCSGNARLHKGENIKLLMKKNNIKNAIYVGDTNGDLDAAKIAKIPFVYASYGFGKVQEYDYIINNIKDLLKIVE